jgi:regulator of nucleoside diphosphate kinase
MPKLNEKLPRIFIEAADRDRLRRLAYAAIDRMPEVAEELLQELDRAENLSQEDVVEMGSTVEFETDTGLRHVIKLVFPRDADISTGRISVLTPIGTALLGLSVGQRMRFTDREGRQRRLTILAVSMPESS